MHQDPDLTQALTAYEQARTTAADTTTVAKMTIATYVRIATQQGHSTRDIARALAIPKSTIYRARFGISLPEPWSTPQGYIRAHNAAWADVPTQQITRAPFEIHHKDGTQRYTLTGDMARAADPNAFNTQEGANTNDQ